MNTRELPWSEWPKLVIDRVEPFATHGLPPANDHWRIVVTEIDDRIVAAVSLHTQVHFDPWWIADEHRKNPGVVRGLLRESLSILDTVGIDHVFATVAEPAVAALAEHLGFRPAPGTLYLLTTTQIDREEL